MWLLIILTQWEERNINVCISIPFLNVKWNAEWYQEGCLIVFFSYMCNNTEIYSSFFLHSENSMKVNLMQIYDSFMCWKWTNTFYVYFMIMDTVHIYIHLVFFKLKFLFYIKWRICCVRMIVLTLIFVILNEFYFILNLSSWKIKFLGWIWKD